MEYFILTHGKDGWEKQEVEPLETVSLFEGKTEFFVYKSPFRKRAYFIAEKSTGCLVGTSYFSGGKPYAGTKSKAVEAMGELAGDTNYRRWKRAVNACRNNDDYKRLKNWKVS